MYLKEIRIENFTSYRGETRIRFSKNLNIVVGPNGVGKTNLAKAISLALTGQPIDNTSLNAIELYNRDYMEECIRNSATPKWEIEATIDIDDNEYSAVCRTIISRDEAIYTHRSPVATQSRVYREEGCLYVKAEGDQILRQGTRAHYKKTQQNLPIALGSGVGDFSLSVIEDGDYRLSKTDFRFYLDELGLIGGGQVVLLLSSLTDINLSGIQTNIIKLKWDPLVGSSIVIL